MIFSTIGRWNRFAAKNHRRCGIPLSPQIVKALKLTFILLTAALLQVSAKGLSQNVSLNLRNAPLEKVFREIARQTHFGFVYTRDMLQDIPNVDINVKNAPLMEVLNFCFKGRPLEFSIQDKTIVLTRESRAALTVPPAAVIAPPPRSTITGTVRDEMKNPVASVSVVIPGTPFGVMTNAKGEYTITDVPEGSRLFFSYVGYQSQSVEIKGRTVIDVVLKLAVRQLDETVIMGYGTTSRRKSTGSISSVTSEEISKQPVESPLLAMEGRIAGAEIIQSNGLPGSSVSILIRGLNSISNGTVPLFIIDGVPFNIQDQSVPATNNLNSFGLFAANGGISPFSMINPADIERIDVLKDADATAIYGTRGSNGVVLITTKKGRSGRTKVEFNVNDGWGAVPRFVKMMNLDQYLAMRKEALTNDGLTPDPGSAPDLTTWSQTATTADWQKKYIGGTANIQDAEGNVSGGDANTRFILAGGYHKETTVYPGSWGSQRISTRFNVEHNSPDQKFFAGISTIYSYNKTNLLSTDLASATYNLPPNLPLYHPDGSLFWDPNFTNPESYFQQKYIGKTNNLVSNIQLRYTLLRGLDLKTSIGYNMISIDQNQQLPASSQNPSYGQTLNNADFATVTQQGYIVEPQIVYNTTIGEGRLTTLLGGTLNGTNNKTTSIYASGYSNPGLLGGLPGAASYSIPSFANTITLYRYQSVFGRLTYDWASKYIFNANIRRDGSSRFGEDHRFGTFGSVAGAWVFTNEKSIAKALPFLSFGKLRASYGITGNDQLQDYQFLATLSPGSGSYNYQGTSILYPSRVANSQLHWETNKKMEFGLELGLLEDKIVFTGNYYRNRSNNQLSYLSLSSQTGFNSYAGNMPALLQNRGLEFELNTRNITRTDFKWTTSFNLTIPKNTLLKVDPNYFYASYYVLGHSLSQVLSFIFEGLDSTGQSVYKNLTTGGKTSTPDYSMDRKLIGDADPKFYGGLTNNFVYKDFELSFFFQFTKKNGNIYPGSVPGPLYVGNPQVYWLSGLKTAASVRSLPRPSTYGSDYYYGSSSAVWGDNSFIRLRNASIAYNFPEKFRARMKMSMLRIYAQGQNLYTWTKNKYSLDPETSTVQNQSPVVMPPLRIITFGLNCSF